MRGAAAWLIHVWVFPMTRDDEYVDITWHRTESVEELHCNDSTLELPYYSFCQERKDCFTVGTRPWKKIFPRVITL